MAFGPGIVLDAEASAVAQGRTGSLIGEPNLERATDVLRKIMNSRTWPPPLVLVSVRVNTLFDKALLLLKVPASESTVQACPSTPAKVTGRVPMVTTQTLLVVEP